MKARRKQRSLIAFVATGALVAALLPFTLLVCVCSYRIVTGVADWFVEPECYLICLPLLTIALTPIGAVLGSLGWALFTLVGLVSRKANATSK